MIKPPEDSDPDALFRHALSLHDSGSVKEAVLLYKQLLDQSPTNPKILTAYGIALVQLESSAEGIHLLEKSLDISPDQSIAHFYIGYALVDLKLFDKALASCDRAIALRSDYADAYSNRADILSTLKRFDEALISCDHAISLNPNLAEAYNIRGVVLNELKRFDEAMWSYEQAISLKPDYAEAYWNNSLNKLILGDYEKGWKLYEYRWESSLKKYAREFLEPLWLGGDTPISGKTVLIYAEQGFGDVIQFCRYVHMVKDFGANVVLEVQSPLVPLFSTLINDIIIVNYGDQLPYFDFQCPIMSLSLAFKTTVETIPANIPYLFVDVDKQKIWKERLGAKTKKRIGLVCSGSTTHKEDSTRSFPFYLLKPLLDLPFEFHLLQKETRAEDKIFLAEHSQIQTHHEDLADFSDTSALIKEMDLVISVDTSVAHLAGALGHPVWILLAWKPDWRWLLDRTDSPWYPSATLFRQSEMGKWEGVISDVCRQLVDDSSFDELFNHALLLQQSGNVKEALTLYKQLLNHFPNHAMVYFHMGNALHNLNRFDEAIISYDRTIALKSDFAEVYCNRADTLIVLKQFDEALISCDCAIALNLNLAEAHNNRGVALNELKRFDEALLSCDKAIELNPNFANAYRNHGVVLGKLKRFDESMLYYEQSIALNSNQPIVYLGIGNILENLKRFDEALVNYDQAIALKPDFDDAYWNKSLVELSLGRYELGWKLYEWRWKSSLKEYVREFSEPLWLGETSISGKTVLIYAEQGFGDVIQFCRYVLLVKDLGANVILEVPSSLVSIISTLNADISVIEQGTSLPAFDFQCPMMSLPLAFKTTVETIPVNVPYLFCGLEKQKKWKERLGPKMKKRIGFVCSGSTIHKDDTKRSIPLHLLKPLLDLPFEFHLLQKEIRSDDEAFLAENSQIQTHQENLIDFSDTAALVKEMDLIISVDTSVAHLAGALGHPVWILLAWKSDWRWLLDRTDSPWYPTATLLRQPEMGNWERVITDVCQRLSRND